MTKEKSKWNSLSLALASTLVIVAVIAYYAIWYHWSPLTEELTNQLAPSFCQNITYETEYDWVCVNETYGCNYTLNDLLEEFEADYPNTTSYNASVFLEFTLQIKNQTISWNMTDWDEFNKFFRLCKYESYSCSNIPINKSFTTGRYFSDSQGWGIECINMKPFTTCEGEEILIELRQKSVEIPKIIINDLKTAKVLLEIKDLNSNQVVEVLADDPGFEEDVTTWCKETNNELLSLTKNEEDIFVAYVEKTC